MLIETPDPDPLGYTETATPSPVRWAAKLVAAQLFLSRRTVEYHLGKVFVKLGVGSRLELARVALDPVLVSSEP